MNIQNTNYGHFIIANKNRIVFFILLFVLSSMKMFGQTVSFPIVIENKQEVTFTILQTETAVTSLESQIDFVGWFMGSRQLHNDDNQSATSSNMAPTKKQILTSGITPNRVLYRTFMKKVSSRNNEIV